MEYRDIFFIVVRSKRSSNTWYWTVDLDARTVVAGKAASEEAAIKAAEKLIDATLAERENVILLRRDRDE